MKTGARGAITLQGYLSLPPGPGSLPQRLVGRMTSFADHRSRRPQRVSINRPSHRPAEVFVSPHQPTCSSTRLTRRRLRATRLAGRCAVVCTLLAGMGFSVVSGITTPPPAGAQAVGAPPDYAAETFGDPWDYNNSQDQIVLEGQQTVGLQNAQIGGGALRFDVSGPSYFHFLWGGYPDSTPANRDGALNPVDTSRFNRRPRRRRCLRSCTSGFRPACTAMW